MEVIKGGADKVLKNFQ